MRKGRCVLLVGLAVGGLAWAAPSSPLQLVLSQFLVKITVQDGKRQEQLVAAPKEALPGSLLEEQLTASNTGTKVLSHVLLHLPIPAGTTYISQSGAPADTTTEFSFDGGKSYGAAPLKRSVTVTENGKSVTKEVVVPPTDYTNVRWTLPTLAAGHEAKLSLRVQVK